MGATTMARINRLSAERHRLYGEASSRDVGDVSILLRISELSRQIDSLWERRRRERAGTREGIDLLIDRIYERAYGSDFEEAEARSAREGVEQGLVAA